MTKTKRDDEKLATLEAALGHRFADRSLLRQALTHASAADDPRDSNQRLEFLGDRVLGLLTAEALIRRHRGEEEGRLAPRLNALVRRETCAEMAERLELGAHLRMARAEAMSGGRKKAALLADAMEAVIAAVYLDGGLEAARSVFLALWEQALEAQEDAPIDAKTALQEWAQARGAALPSYRLVDRSGPDHAPVFTVEARLENGASAVGSAASKRGAEQLAAGVLLEKVQTE